MVEACFPDRLLEVRFLSPAPLIMGLVIINLLILLANLGVLALSIKLYTEYFKDRKITDRSKHDI